MNISAIQSTNKRGVSMTDKAKQTAVQTRRAVIKAVRLAAVVAPVVGIYYLNDGSIQPAHILMVLLGQFSLFIGLKYL